MDQLPAVDTRIPDLAPSNAPDSSQTIYTAVNLELYMTQNPLGFLGGDWAPGQTLSELGLEIVNGQIRGVQGMYWATTPFAFDSDSTGVGFTPEGGPETLLNSADYGLDLVIIQQHESPAVSEPPPMEEDPPPSEEPPPDDGSGIPVWIWILVAVVVIGIGLFALLRRRSAA